MNILGDALKQALNKNRGLAEHFIIDHAKNVKGCINFGIADGDMFKQMVKVLKKDTLLEVIKNQNLKSSCQKYVTRKNTSLTLHEMEILFSLNEADISNAMVSKMTKASSSLIHENGYQLLKMCLENQWIKSFKALAKEKDPSIVFTTNSSGDSIVHDVLKSENISLLQFLLECHPNLAKHQTSSKKNIIHEALELIQNGKLRLR